MHFKAIYIFCCFVYIYIWYLVYSSIRKILFTAKYYDLLQHTLHPIVPQYTPDLVLLACNCAMLILTVQVVVFSDFAFISYCNDSYSADEALFDIEWINYFALIWFNEFLYSLITFWKIAEYIKIFYIIAFLLFFD